MKAAVYYGRHDLRLSEVAATTPGDAQVCVRDASYRRRGKVVIKT